MLAGLNGEIILFEFMLGFILHPNLPRLFVRPHFVFEGVWATAQRRALTRWLGLVRRTCIPEKGRRTAFQECEDDPLS